MKSKKVTQLTLCLRIQEARGKMKNLHINTKVSPLVIV